MFASNWARAEVVGPRPLAEARVELPESAELGTAQTRVPVHLVVESDGTVSQVELLQPHGGILDAAVRRAAADMRFVPAERDGQPMRVRIAYEIPLRAPTPTTAGSPAGISAAHTTAYATSPTTSSTTSSTTDEATDASSPTHESPSAPTLLAALPPTAGGSISEVVVTGARVPERRSESVISTQVIDREALRRSGATNVGAALEAEPGLQVERTFRGTEVWIRGLDPEYTLILLDGQRLPGRVGGAIDLSRYPLENVERVEIVRGPSSALYGSDAIGGTINIVTRES
ncbi:MAG TPA: TonB family protein, partial [Polyangiaceae bacterium]|nr:TonB family protein [Polyangiaceae bacterium]